jgi:UDP-3-O-[3-hydroxymyristoyl] glucosamine N-acyltransferase
LESLPVIFIEEFRVQYPLSEIADLIRGQVVGDEQVLIHGINSLEEASPGEISIFSHRRYREWIGKTRASALVVSRVVDLFEGPQVVVPHPALAYPHLARLFSPPPPAFVGISPGAVIHESATIGTQATLYPTVYVGAGAKIGDGVTLYPGVFIGDRVKVGNGTVLFPNVAVLQDCIIGARVTIHAGSVIGSDGFGFVWDGAEHIKVPQIGFVQIDDRVEIGANNTIDRATMGKTWIQAGVKTDNMVHIAHNVVIGEHTIIVAQSAIGGSARIGRQVVIGGQAAISDHVEVGDKAMIGSKTGVPKSIPPGELISGIPGFSHRLWLKSSKLIPRLPEFQDRLRKLEKGLEELNAHVDPLEGPEKET